MTWIRVISTKVAKPLLYGCETNCFVTYVNKLTNAARSKSGFIESDSHWKGDKYDTIVSISTWTSEKYWQEWLKSQTRDTIYKKHESVIESEKHELLRKRKISKDIFLL